jgi:hypothetical protein
MKKLLFVLLTITLIAFGGLGLNQTTNTKTLGFAEISEDFDDHDLPELPTI